MPICPWCTLDFGSKGFVAHERRCRKTFRDRIRSAALTEHFQNPQTQLPIHVASAGPIQASDANMMDVDSGVEVSNAVSGDDDGIIVDVPLSDEPEVNPPVVHRQQETPVPGILLSALNEDSIVTQYHPNLSKDPVVQTIEEFVKHSVPKPVPEPNADKPWIPGFPSRFGFEIAQFALDARLNKELTTRFLSIMKTAASGEDIPFNTYESICSAWEIASKRMTKFEKTKFELKYNAADEQPDYYEVHTRDIWGTAMDLIKNPILRPRFHWEPTRMYRFDKGSNRLVRFVDEPWTADEWWDFHSRLPPGGKAVSFILYADKSKLSSFGTHKGYPVILRIGNLPVEDRNGTGLGGGRLVGWLPLADETEERKETTRYANFKCVVWHKSFEILLQKIAAYHHAGYAVKFDDFEAVLFPFLHILSADYEEQTVMALIRGTNGLAFCPTCPIESTLDGLPGLIQISQALPRRTPESVTAVLKEARVCRYETHREALLKPLGLRNIQSCFSKVGLVQPSVFQALSYDDLHGNALGLFGKHIFPELTDRIKALPRGKAQQERLNLQMASMPRWRGLHHFNSVTTITFNDGSKYQDILKQLLFAAHTILTPRSDPSGWILLRCLRALMEFQSFLSFTRHDETTLAQMKEATERFSMLLQEYVASAAQEVPPRIETKSWVFPKAHTYWHAVEDIQRKGAARNFGTKINESLHGPIRKSYQLQTNFKDFAPQILELDHWAFIAADIEERIIHLDEVKRLEEEEAAQDDFTPPDLTLKNSPSNAKLGAKRPPAIGLALLEEAKKDDLAFKWFRRRLNEWLVDYVGHYKLPSPAGGINLGEHDSILEHAYLRAYYRSKVTWGQEVDHLRCSPSFHNSPRYDFVLVDREGSEGGPFFAQLIFLFIVKVLDQPIEAALILPLDAALDPASEQAQRDWELGVIRRRARARSHTVFITVLSVIRGAVLVQDSSGDGRDYLLLDVIDQDMFLRAKGL